MHNIIYTPDAEENLHSIGKFIKPKLQASGPHARICVCQTTVHNYNSIHTHCVTPKCRSNINNMYLHLSSQWSKPS